MRVLLILTGLTLCQPPSIWADDSKPAPGPSYLVPYRLTETKHVLVRAKINGKGPFNFILDTGAPALFVSTAVCRKLGIEADRGGWGTLQRFEIEGGVILAPFRARVEDPFQLEGMNGLGLAGAELHGIIGYTILARYRLEFDFTKTKMLWQRLDYAPPAPLGLEGKATGGGMDAIGSLMKMLGTMLGKKTDAEEKSRGFLGIELADAADGLTVKTVLEHSPAAAAGVQVGDRVTHLQGKVVLNPADAQRVAAQLFAGSTVELTVTRGEVKQIIRIKAREGL
jgi:hypothetical protein